jgi:transaldolase
MIAVDFAPQTRSVAELNVKLFADGADLTAIAALAADPAIAGFTTNPTLMRKAGVDDYERFAREVLAIVKGRPVSFEVFADEFDEMERQAERIAALGRNVYVKIPVTNTKSASTAPLVRRLNRNGIKVNVTAVMTSEQVEQIVQALERDTPSYISIFAGRIADTGRDPMPIVREAVRFAQGRRAVEIIWASPRELLNVFQADEVGCHVITATGDILAKLALVGKSLDAYSLDTVRMFYNDAQSAGYAL